ncbi:restriction endonuclease subunit S [Paraburkholderia atlantica]|uniref:restriction endonuclease subunit S n=1 Tax=Paraburkholderia atlantica TaxID=2654982 RepID=UPI003D262F4D
MSKVSELNLEAYFDAAFSAPSGVARLRELILTLAMQGKLVAQDASDDPASVLLESIAAEKAALAKDGKIRAPKPLSPITEAEKQYALPNGWEWVRLGSIGIVNPRNDVDDDATLAGFVPMPLIPEGYGKQHGFEPRPWGAIKKGFTHFANGDVGMAKITPCFENAKSCVFSDLPNGVGAGTTELHIFRNAFHGIDTDFLLYFLKNPGFIDKAAAQMTGSAGQKRVPTPFFVELLIPLPPMAEQKRIVARIDQLMARCDELEKLRTEQQEKRSITHTTALRQWLSADDAHVQAHAQRFIAGHFDELHASRESVAGLRKAILQLAMMGRLVPQDASDEPASVLLEKITAEKATLVKAGKIRAPKPLPSIADSEKPYAVPNGWEWVRIASIAESIDYGTSQKTCDDSSLVPVYRMGNIVEGILIDENMKYISPNIQDLPFLYLETGDILFNRTNSYELVGKSALYFGASRTATFASYLIRIRLMKGHVSERYVGLAMNSRYFRETQIEPEIVQQCGQANFNGTKLSMCAVPMPPVAEQKRIVAKLDELMALCDALECRIDAAESTQSQLLQAVMAAA